MRMHEIPLPDGEMDVLEGGELLSPRSEELVDAHQVHQFCRCGGCHGALLQTEALGGCAVEAPPEQPVDKNDGEHHDQGRGQEHGLIVPNCSISPKSLKLLKRGHENASRGSRPTPLLASICA